MSSGSGSGSGNGSSLRPSRSSPALTSQHHQQPSQQPPWGSPIVEEDVVAVEKMGLREVILGVFFGGGKDSWLERILVAAARA